MTDNLIERALDRAIERLRVLDNYAGLPQWDAVLREELSQALKAKDAEIERLREALKPFADWPVLEAYDDGNYVDCAFQAGHFRAARKALGGRDGE